MDKSDLIIKQLHDEAAKLLAQNFSDDQIILELKKFGIEDAYAEMVLLNAKEDKLDKKDFYKHLFGGIFILAAGAISSVESYKLALPGGLYIVFTGVMIYGIFAITRAIVIFRK
jgi:hypothetical protein